MTPGSRLRRARMQSGFKKTTELEARLAESGWHIPAKKLGALERDEIKLGPTPEEIKAICQTLNISADWWLCGEEASTHLISKRLAELSKRDRQLVLGFIELLEKNT